MPADPFSIVTVYEHITVIKHSHGLCGTGIQALGTFKAVIGIVMEPQKARTLEICPRDFNR